MNLSKRGVVGRLALFGFLFCALFGVLSVFVFSYINTPFLCEHIFPSLRNLFSSPEGICIASDLLWANLLVAVIVYAGIYLSALPIWINASKDRKNWDDWREGPWSLVAIFFLYIVIFIGNIKYIFTNLIMGKFTNVEFLDTYGFSALNVLYYMLPINFLAFVATLLFSGKIFGRGASNAGD